MKTHLIKQAVISLCLACSLTTIASAENKDGKGAPSTPKEFIKGAVEANRAELTAGKLAQSKGQHPDVKELGQTLVQDHAKVQEKLRDLAQKYQISMDGEADVEHQQELKSLQNATGQQFDRAFLNHIIQDHQRDIQMLQQCSETFADNSEIKQLIDQNLPIVRQHLEMAKAASQNIQSTRSDQGENASASRESNEGRGSASAASESGAAASSRQNQNANAGAQDNEIPGTGINKRDNEFLGLPTSKNDGTILGVVPAPSRTVEAGSNEKYIAEELKDGKVNPNIDNVFQADHDTISAPPTAEFGKPGPGAALPQQVTQALKEHGINRENASVTPLTVYRIQGNGKTIHVTTDGKVIGQSNSKGQAEK